MEYFPLDMIRSIRNDLLQKSDLYALPDFPHSTPEAREAISAMVPMPLNGYLEAENVASLLIWLASAENTHTTGQTIYIDGGSDAVLRGENIWDLAPQA